MSPAGVDQKLRTFAERALSLSHELLPLASPIARCEAWTPTQRSSMACLMLASARTTESALLLVGLGQLWDAEALARSVAEGSLKYLYMLQSRETFDRRHREYVDDLSRLALLEDHERASQLLSAVPDPTALEWQNVRESTLSPQDIEILSEVYPAERRQELGSGWGYAGLTRALMRSGDPLLLRFAAIANGYSTARHVIRGDHIGTAIAAEQDRPASEGRQAILLAHGGKVISDLLSGMLLRLLAGYRFIGKDRTSLGEASDRIADLLSGVAGIEPDRIDVEYPKEPQ